VPPGAPIGAHALVVLDAPNAGHGAIGMTLTVVVMGVWGADRR
jgi:hypothetical protein